MEFLFDYETAKHALVLFAFWMLIFFDCWWIGYLIAAVIRWIIKIIKALYKKLFRKNGTVEQDEIKEDTTNE